MLLKGIHEERFSLNNRLWGKETSKMEAKA